MLSLQENNLQFSTNNPRKVRMVNT